MSRAYDAKQAALSAFSENRQAAIDLFIGYLGCDVYDFEYEEGMTVEEYIFGDADNSKGGES